MASFPIPVLDLSVDIATEKSLGHRALLSIDIKACHKAIADGLIEFDSSQS